MSKDGQYSKKQLLEAILKSVKKLQHHDGALFGLPIEDGASEDSRKLHEVCINHKLAEHLGAQILPLLGNCQNMFVDIEFNREGINFKSTTIEGEQLMVRPDIIIHNRKSNGEKFNFLVVECKKSNASSEELERDLKKLKALMDNPVYNYNFGLQVVYDVAVVTVKMLYKQDGSIKEEIYNVSVS